MERAVIALTLLAALYFERPTLHEENWNYVGVYSYIDQLSAIADALFCGSPTQLSDLCFYVSYQNSCWELCVVTTNSHTYIHIYKHRGLLWLLGEGNANL